MSCVTYAQATLLQTRFVDVLHAKYSTKHRYHGLNLLGTCQHAAGIPGAMPGRPNWDVYTPTQYVRNDSDVLGCVHLTKLGFHTVLTELAAHF